ncbi:type II secretion system F family protein [Yersinia enterocolitica]|uniref:type II secretion system F family protein n=1 Tax=Yersinia enterocolitica TaxID=630 RepID=UPI00030EB2F6|nr:type II secretion system F family protein [Yersinia enterocolitica]
MVTSHWIEDNIVSIIIILVIFSFSIYGISKIRKINMFIESCYLKLPIFGRLIFKLNISRYMRMMAILSSNGVNLIRTMDVSTGVVTNLYIKQRLDDAVTLVSEGGSLSSSLSNSRMFSPLYIKQRLDDAVTLVSEGGSLSSSLSNSRMFSPMTIHMIASGERSGKLDEVLKKITDIQEQEIIEEINVFVILLEPVIMISMASFIFFIVLAIFQPILEMNNLIF